MERLLALSLLALVACSGDDKNDDSGSSADGTDGTSADGTGADGTDGTDGTADGYETTAFFTEFLSGSPMVGATVTSGDQTATTDDEGKASFTFAGDENVTFLTTLDGFPDVYSYWWVPALDFQLFTPVPSYGTIDLLSTALGLPYDETKVLLNVSVVNYVPGNDEPSVPLDGTVVELDADYALALTSDGTPTGLAPGNTVAGGSIIFVNVEPGTVTPTLTLPGGETCEGHVSFDAVAGGYVDATYICN